MRALFLAGYLLVWLVAGCGGSVPPTTAGAGVPEPGAPPTATGEAVSARTVAPTATYEPAHDFTLPTLDGASVTLSDLRGRWVIVNFWASWCGPCVREMAYLGELAATRDLTVLGVNFNEDPATVNKFVAEQGISFPILLAPDDITELMYQVRGLPRTFVISPAGTIATRVIGELDPERFDAWLDAHQVPRKR